MLFEIEVGGRARVVHIERLDARPSLFRVSIDGRARDVDAVRLDATTFSLLFDGGRSEQVGISSRGSRGELLVHVRGGSVAVTVNGRRRRRPGAHAGASGAEQRIVAPMPGRVVRVLVAPGEAVQARQPLVVIEAMKMENEFRAASAGRVKEVGVREGTSVETGRLLVVIE